MTEPFFHSLVLLFIRHPLQLSRGPQTIFNLLIVTDVMRMIINLTVSGLTSHPGAHPGTLYGSGGLLPVLVRYLSQNTTQFS